MMDGKCPGKIRIHGLRDMNFALHLAVTFLASDRIGMEKQRFGVLGAKTISDRATRHAAKVLSDVSSLTTTEQPRHTFQSDPRKRSEFHDHLHDDVPFPDPRVTSRGVIELSCNRDHGEPEIKPACPAFSFTANAHALIQ